MTIPRPEFPRPDFERKDWVNLNGEWEFSFEQGRFDKKIIVPFCYQSKLSGIGDLTDHDIVWYRRNFEVEEEKIRNKKLLLKFGAVDYEAQIWINDIYIGKHEGGHVAFELDITHVVEAGENTIVVKVCDYNNTDKPRGKQTWIGEKFGCWYTPTTGIWQTVWLEYVGKSYLKKVKITPNIKDLSAKCEIFISSYKDIEVSAEAMMETDGKIYSFGRYEITCKNGYGKIIIPFQDFDLRRDQIYWSPEHPNLIDVKIKVKNETGDDEVNTYFGMREVGSYQSKLTLNNDFYYQRLILDQGYWSNSILTPPGDEAIIKDITLTKEMGFNGVRKHQKIEDPRYYYWADKLGLLVWGELPSAYEFNNNAIKNSSRELIEFVERDYNHPCIVTWVPINESWGVRNIQVDKQQQDYSRMLIYLLKSIDPIRLVSGNDGWEQVSETDICAVHDYSLFPSTIAKYEDIEKLLKGVAESRMLFAEGNAYKGQPIVLTEYGGIAFAKENDAGWGYYDKVKDNDEFLARLEPITTYLIKSGKFSGFCYTQLTDVMQEVNGLLSEARQPKIPIKQLKKIFSQRIY